MTQNPYEPPQTIDTPPPVAEEVLVATIDFAALAKAAAGCSRAGKFYLIAACLTAGEIVGASIMPLETIRLLWALLIFAPFLVSLFILGWGVFLNTIACWQFKIELPDPNLRRLYARCQRASWLKLVLCVSMVFIPTASYRGGHGSYAYVTVWELLWLYVPAIVLLINSVVTVVLHFRGMNDLGELIHSKTADKLASLYLFSGVPATLIAVSLFLVLRSIDHFHSAPPLLLALVPVLLLPMFAAYQLAYRRLGEAFRIEAEKK